MSIDIKIDDPNVIVEIGLSTVAKPVEGRLIRMHNKSLYILEQSESDPNTTVPFESWQEVLSGMWRHELFGRRSRACVLRRISHTQAEALIEASNRQKGLA